MAQSVHDIIIQLKVRGSKEAKEALKGQNSALDRSSKKKKKDMTQEERRTEAMKQSTKQQRRQQQVAQKIGKTRQRALQQQARLEDQRVRGIRNTLKQSDSLQREAKQIGQAKAQWGTYQAKQADANTQMDKLMRSMGDTTPQRNFNKELSAAGMKMSKFNQVARTNNWTLTRGGQVWDNFNKQIVPTGKALQETRKETERFKMEWLSVMFFSMNISRRLRSVMVSSVKTFTKIAGKNNEAAQAVAQLGAQFKFLKFQIGQAIGQTLQKHMPTIIAVVDAVANFVQQNPQKVVWGLVGAFAAFKALNIAAQLSLVASGISQIASNISSALHNASLTGFISKLRTLSTIAGIPIAIYFLWKGITEENVKESLLQIGVGSGIAGAIAAMWFGGPVGAIVAGLTMIIATQIKFNWLGDLKEKWNDFVGDVKDKIHTWTTEGLSTKTGGKPSYEFDVGTNVLSSGGSVGETEESMNNTEETVKTTTKEISKSWNGTLSSIQQKTNQTFVGGGGGKEENKSIIGNITKMQKEFEKKTYGTGGEGKGGKGAGDSIKQNWESTMNSNETKTISYVKRTIKEFGKIPRNITTTHTIERNYVGGGGGGLLGSFQSGGVVPETGPYLLHKGETVVPNDVTNNVSVNVSGGGGNGASPQAIAKTVSDELNKQLRKYI